MKKKKYNKPKLSTRTIPVSLLLKSHHFYDFDNLFVSEVYAASSILPPIGGRCFIAGTRILLSTKKTKPIELIQVNDAVLSYNTDTQAYTKAIITDTESHYRDDGYFLLNNKIKVTHDHPLWVNDSWKTVEFIAIGDELVDSTGKSILVHTKEYIRGRVLVYNFQVDHGKGTFFADNILANSYL